MSVSWAFRFRTAAMKFAGRSRSSCSLRESVLRMRGPRMNDDHHDDRRQAAMLSMADASVSSFPFLPLERRAAAAIPSLPHGSARANQAACKRRRRQPTADSRQLTRATCNDGGREMEMPGVAFKAFSWLQCASGETDAALQLPATRRWRGSIQRKLWTRRSCHQARAAPTPLPPAAWMTTFTNVVRIDRRLRSPGILFPGSFADR
jgi:hypothetical protein